jgi:hypothetical protein
MKIPRPFFALIFSICVSFVLFVLTFIDQEQRPGQGEVGINISMVLPYLTTQLFGLNHEPNDSFVNSTTFDAIVNALFGLLLCGVILILWRLIKGKTPG